MSDPNDGIVDTNIFVHAHANDALTAECVAFLAAPAQGTLRAQLEPLVVHELTYVLPRVMKQMSQTNVASYLLMVLGWPGILGDKPVMRDAIERCVRTPGLNFVDAYLAALATVRSCPVYTKNVGHLAAQGVSVPDPLPDGTNP